MNLNIENLVRSAAVVVVGLPIALSVTNLSSVTTRLVEQNLGNPTAEVVDTLKANLAEPCTRYMISKNDSKLEREAIVDIEEVAGGSVNPRETCNWVL